MQDSGGRQLQHDAGELTHRRMVVLLKLLQRNKMFTPDKAILHLWNDFCDKESPSGPDGKPFRDPNRLDMELIIEFLVSRIPKPFWEILVKKLQTQGREQGLGDLWHEFCDSYAPPNNSRGGEGGTRDPKLIDPELLLAFVSSQIDSDKGSKVMEIIDGYTFEFPLVRESGDKPVRQGRGADERDKGRGKDKGKSKVNGEELAFTEIIELDEGLDSRFRFMHRLIGKEGCNVKHIREHTGASVWLGGRGSGRLEYDTNEESPSPLHVKITAETEDSLERAMKIARDLVETISDDYRAWLDGEGKR